MVGISVTEAVYQLERNPPVDKPVTFDHEAVCGNCSRFTETAPAGKVLTPQFGSWDTITEATTGGRWLCQPCAWAYRAVPYRRAPTIVTCGTSGEEDGKGLGARVEWATNADLLDALDHPTDSRTALVIPLSGKKIVLPKAQWGMVATDTKVFRWSPRNRRQLRAAAELRAMKVGEASLAEDSPPFYLLDKTDPTEHARIKELWAVLAPVRADKTMLPFIQKITRKDKT